ncbi:Ferritin-like domain-containing protein [Chitinophaga sp. YR573]|uniref:ferritin-like domain-containing protein n=1 Tax=Chitinophaga sp. YR573 TaxID=1881040 RepID=UPI0008C27F29|nr:ferritin-like domain-containing protein [Chitinophaga sp. YR573]SEW10284.1 Ferritin-like domain-containing protein [Chitinophaga sp. YR573]
MDLQNILTAIEKTDPEIYERLDTRRSAMKSFANVGKVLALSAIPLALSSMFKKAYGRTPADVLSVLQFALLLEHLESGFYTEAITHTSLFDAAGLAAFTTISNHEAAHVTLLTQTIQALGGTPDPAPTFDYTADGTFPSVFSSYSTLLAIAQGFEDTGVRAYKGQAANLQENKTVLTVALQIHSVEARHAAHIRRMRGQKGWITGKATDISAIQATYNGEEVEAQGGVTITGIASQVDANAATESFDEPLDRAAVTAIVSPFIVTV